MKFLKKRSGYKVMYSKSEAKELLTADRRVKKVTVTQRRMYIYTKPIIPVVTKEAYKDTFLCPIGTYKIVITSYSHNIYAKVRREKSIGKMHHYHIQENWDHEGCCWGSAESEVDTIEDNKDWFWLAKRCLDLLEDGNPEHGETEKFYGNVYDLMIDYASSKRNRKLAKKLRRIQKAKLKNYEG